MDNTLTSTSDLQTCCSNDSVLTINDDGVGINIKPFLGCKITPNRQCKPIPFVEPLIRRFGTVITPWNKYAEPFADIDERILTEESYFMCANTGFTKVDIADPGQGDVRVGDAHKICEVPAITNWVIVNGFITNDPDIIKNHVPELERRADGSQGASMGNVNGIVLHRTVNGSAADTFQSFSTLRTESSGAQYYAGTHFVVGKDGAIYQTSNLNIRTNHVSGLNTERVGIEVVGNALDANGQPTQGPPHGNQVVGWEPLTPEQEEGVAYLTNNLLNEYNLNVANVEVHEDLEAKTAGEGQTVYDAIIDDIDPIDNQIKCDISRIIDRLFRFNDAQSTGKLIAVDGATIVCPNAIAIVPAPMFY